jgi:hypothetical protein
LHFLAQIHGIVLVSMDVRRLDRIGNRPEACPASLTDAQSSTDPERIAPAYRGASLSAPDLLKTETWSSTRRPTRPNFVAKVSGLWRGGLPLLGFLMS